MTGNYMYAWRQNNNKAWVHRISLVSITNDRKKCENCSQNIICFLIIWLPRKLCHMKWLAENKQIDFFCVFNMVLIPIQAGTLMGKKIIFYEQPMIKEGNEIYRFGCPEFENRDNQDSFLISRMHCAMNEQSEGTLWYYCTSTIIFENSTYIHTNQLCFWLRNTHSWKNFKAF